MPEIVFFLEEKSAEALLRSLLPRMFPNNDVKFTYRVYNGKQDLQKNIIRDLKHHPNLKAQLIILHDQDSADCRVLKSKLQVLCKNWEQRLTIRIACRELESWYLGQLDVVEKVFDKKGLAALQAKKKFRNPDLLSNPDLILQDLLKTLPYSKIKDSRRLGEEINPDNGCSSSFHVFIQAVRTAVSKTCTD